MAHTDQKTGYTFGKGLVPTNFTILHDKGRNVVAAFDGEINGRKIFNIRELYEEYGEWCPGKGISVPLDRKKELLTEIVKYAIEQGIVTQANKKDPT